MRPGGGSQKGAGFEREICRRLGLWLTNGYRDDLFWRTPMSGGRATLRIGAGYVNRSQVGDVGPIDPLGWELFSQFVFTECKNVASLDVLLGLTRNSGRLHNYWQKAAAEAKAAEREPWLIAHELRSEVLLFTTQVSADHFDFPYGPSFTIHSWDDERPVLGFLFDFIVPRLEHWSAS